MGNLSFTIKIDNTEAIKKATAENIDRALEIIGGKAENYALMLAPVVTGNLKRSMRHEVHADKGYVIVGNIAEYSPSVEFGHRQEPGRYVPAIGKRLVAEHVAAKPFLQPAIERHLDEYKHILENELKM